MIEPVLTRTIFINDKFGMRQVKETLGNLMVAACISHERFWLVSAWLTDFALLDNRGGDWDALNPAWGHRIINFSEVIVHAVESGSVVSIVTNKEPVNNTFQGRLKQALPNSQNLFIAQSQNLHKKGLLSPSYFLAGSMNFTYSGTNKKEEQITLNLDPDTIFEAKLEFESLYGDLLSV